MDHVRQIILGLQRKAETGLLQIKASLKEVHTCQTKVDKAFKT